MSSFDQDPEKHVTSLADDAHLPRLTPGEYDRFRSLVREHTGIALGGDKQSLLEGRLSKRLRALGLASFAEYHHYLTLPANARELVFFADIVTTNKTDFFREAHHFEFLAQRWWPEHRAKDTHKIRIWSAACSSGEEPYTIAFTLLDALGLDARSWDFRILASDISTRVLERAQSGLYALDRVTTVPHELLRRHFLRGTGANEGFAQVRADIRAAITFRRINFMDAAWPIRTQFDVIFCRNALIYFDRPTQEAIVRKLLKHLSPGGYLVLGHSECIHGWFEELEHLGNTIYRLRAPAPGA